MIFRWRPHHKTEASNVVETLTVVTLHAYNRLAHRYLLGDPVSVYVLSHEVKIDHIDSFLVNESKATDL